jgi:hypothetical protein
VEKERFSQMLIDLNLPTPIVLDYPFGIGLVGGPAYALFDKPEHAIAAVSQLNSQSLRTEHRVRSQGEGRRDERLRNQYPGVLSDLGFGSPSKGFEEIKALGRIELERCFFN